MKKIIISALLALTIIGGYFFPVILQKEANSLGAINFVGSLPTNLSGSGITSSATSIGVTSLTIQQTGQKLSMTDFGDIGYITLEPGSPTKQEFASFTGISQNSNGSAILTGVTRGLSPIYPYTASSTMRYSHGGTSRLIVSNSPPFYNTFANQQNSATVTAPWTFMSWALPGVSNTTTDAQVSAATTTLATVGYVQSVSFAGGVNSTVGVKGVVQLATAAQASSTTALAGGSSGASLVPATNIFSGTPGASLIPVAQSTGKILQGWLDLAARWIFTGPVTIPATSANPLTINTLTYTYPSVRGASSTVAIEDGSGNLRYYDGGQLSTYQAYIQMATSSASCVSIGGCFAPGYIASSTVAGGAFSCDATGASPKKQVGITIWKYGTIVAMGSQRNTGAFQSTISISKNGLSTTSVSNSSATAWTASALFNVVPGDEIAYYCNEDNASANPEARSLSIFATSTNQGPSVTY
jgi:hypothetical protein